MCPVYTLEVELVDLEMIYKTGNGIHGHRPGRFALEEQVCNKLWLVGDRYDSLDRWNVLDKRIVEYWKRREVLSEMPVVEGLGINRSHFPGDE